MSKHTATTSTEKEPGSFLTGLTLGLIAGAVGHFLFTTDRGEKTRKAMQEEWKIAQKEFNKATTKTRVENLEDVEEKIEHAAVSLRDMVKKGIKHLADQVDESSEKPASKSKSKPAKKKKTAKKKTFSGV